MNKDKSILTFITSISLRGYNTLLEVLVSSRLYIFLANIIRDNKTFRMVSVPVRYVLSELCKKKHPFCILKTLFHDFLSIWSRVAYQTQAPKFLFQKSKVLFWIAQLLTPEMRVEGKDLNINLLQTIGTQL